MKKTYPARDIPVLWQGYDVKIFTENAPDHVFCSVCSKEMIKKESIGPVNFATAMAKKDIKHTTFTCPNAGLDWHVKVVKLMMEMNQTTSTRVAAILYDEISSILNENLK